MDAADCLPPDCVLVIERPSGEEPLPLVELMAPLDNALASVTAATGFGLEDQLSEEELAELDRQELQLPGFELSYLRAGDPEGRRILFLHGSPGEATEWGSFLQDVPEGLEYLAVDRPGFGESGPEDGLASLEEQAEALRPLLEVRPAGKTLLVGYSYGAPLAVRLAADNRDSVAGLLLIGAALDPALEEVHPLQVLATTPPLAALLPRDLANANAELLTLQQDLEVLEAELHRLAMPVVLVHGTADSLVEPENLNFAEARLAAGAAAFTIVLIEGADHFLPWTHHRLLAESLAMLLQQAGP